MAIADYYCTITKLTKASTPNGRGGSVLEWKSDGTFQGLINQASSREIEAAAKLGIEADYKLYCPVDVSISNNDLLQQGGSYYKVVSKPKNTIGRDHHLKVLLKEVDSNGVREQDPGSESDTD